MSSFRNRLPPLTAFEAAARHRSFTRMAEELRVSQAAVSRQIASLEEALGFALFVRGHRSVERTERERRLSFATTNAFGLVADALSDIQLKDVEESITVVASVAFAHFWLTPRLPLFAAAYPNVKLRIVTRDTPVELNAGDADVAIRSCRTRRTIPPGRAGSNGSRPSRCSPPRVRSACGAVSTRNGAGGAERPGHRAGLEAAGHRPDAGRAPRARHERGDRPAPRLFRRVATAPDQGRRRLLRRMDQGHGAGDGGVTAGLA